MNDELTVARAEADKLISQANVLRLRGQIAEALDMCEQAVKVDPECAAAWEMLGDMRQEAGRMEEAKSAYEKATAIEPGRVSAERKFAECTLALANLKMQQDEWKRMVEGGEKIYMPKRNQGIALLLSALMPGLGQIYNGEFVKAGALMGLTMIGWIVIFASPDGGHVVQNMLKLFFAPPGSVSGVGMSPLIVSTLLSVIALYFYGLLDAVYRAGAHNRALEKGV